MHRAAVWIVLAGLGGCSGGYALTAPDGVGPAGGEVPVVVRLQHRELPFFTPAVQAQALRFRVAGCPLRAAQTDKNGYACAAVPVPSTAGVYPLAVALQDIEGEEARWELRTFVWDPQQPIVAVDLDALLRRGQGTGDAQAALTNLSDKAYILYLTDEPAARYPRLHDRLAAAGLPDGPILPWRGEEWWQLQRWEQQWRQQEWRQWGWWKKMIIVSPLAGLREVFPGLQVGIAGSKLAVQAFQQAGMKCLLVGGVVAVGEGLQPTSWAELAEKGLE
jgi:hypothetical protein